MMVFVVDVVCVPRDGRGPAFGVPPVWAAKPNPPKESLFETLERLAPGPLRCLVARACVLVGYIVPGIAVSCDNMVWAKRGF